MVDSGENILVEFDYNNISIIDPNKVIDSDGNVSERLVKQEDLVVYANLECKVIPRTKLAVGVANNDQIQTVSVAAINFLNPGNKGFLDNSYTDELTGKDSLKGNGQNQVNLESVKNPNKSDDTYIRQTLKGVTDNGLLGITQITIRQGLDFLPQINVKLEDIKGRALFEGGDNSPYAAFFNLPYPMFNLTIKGYYGKAVKLSLMLQNFTSRYDTYSSNFVIDLVFYTYKYTILSEITMGALLAVPHMYKSRVSVQNKVVTPSTGTNSDTTNTTDSVVERGFQKVKEMYSEYKSKGMISDDFPEISLMELQNRLENFVKNVLDSFTKQNLDPLTDLNEYSKILGEYDKDIFAENGESWRTKYLDINEYLVLDNPEKTKVYSFKKEYTPAKKKDEAINKLKEYITSYTEKLANNKTVGILGKYKINNTEKSINIPNNITYEIFPKTLLVGDINIKETYRQRKKSDVDPLPEQLNEFLAELTKDSFLNNLLIKDAAGKETPINDYFIFEGKGTFEFFIDKMGKDLKTYREQIENELTEALSELLQNKDNGIGFVPSIRNVLAVIFANGEAFLRLMDDVHTQAWNVRDDKDRKKAILTGVSSDNLTSGNNNKEPVYPWPQMIVETMTPDKEEQFVITYPGDRTVINQTKAYLPELWPEVEFVEEFIKGYVQRSENPKPSTPNSNELTDVQRISLSAIEFPVSNVVFGNKEEIKYMYEIYERIFLTSYYSKLSRCNNFVSESSQISDIVSEGESINIINSLSTDNPFITKKLTEYGINASNFEILLRHISNDGSGVSWQNFIRGIFNTSYIKNLVNNSNFEFIDSSILNDSISQPLVSLSNEQALTEYISGSTTTNSFDFGDIYPFTDFGWCTSELADGETLFDAKTSFDTRKVLTYNVNKKVISNFLDTTNDDTKRPFTNFSYKNIQQPVLDNPDLKNFYNERDFTSQLLTEGNLNYINYSGLVSSYQTVSMFNTPYFINSIQEGVKNFRDDSVTPYVSSAYLFINSLPLSTLKEKYKTYENKTEKPLDYIFASLKKFGAIHKMPYAWVLKIGSVYHRYKNYVENGVDIINTSWSDFKYVDNYDPTTKDPTKIYSLTINNSNIDIVLEKNTSLGVETQTLINTGFYPKLINDFNVFYQGFEIYSAYTSTDIQNGFSSGVTLNYVKDAIIDMGKGFDEKNLDRNLRVVPWSVAINTFDGNFTYLLPSQGSLINQTKDECITSDNKLKFEISGNTSMYNGSTRLFWTAPNYGYFDNSKVVKPSPLEYLKQVFSGQLEQENFSINGKSNDYTSIDEIFSVFEKNILDGFENEFLKFSKSRYDMDDNSLSNISIGELENGSDKSFKNFQMLMISLMKTTKLTGTTPTDVIIKQQQEQLITLSNTLTKFINTDVVFKYGNPSNFDKKLFYTFSTYQISDPYTWEKYSFKTPNALPYSGGSITLNNSKTRYRQQWKTLETYVGFSDVTKLKYSNNGSYITDFFIDLNIAFNVDNIKNLAPIIKIYATQKLNDPTLDISKFTMLMDEYITSSETFKGKVINNLMPKLQTKLPKIVTSSQKTIDMVLEGPATKVELWESFKAINDKWISGNDFKTKTLFEDIMLIDRASRDVGDKILVDVIKLKDDIATIKPTMSMLVFVQTILVENNFVVMNLPSYVNFYNVQDAVKNPKPRAEGSLEFANTMFGTFLNVDYRNSSPKLVCFYGGKPSEQLDLKDNIDYRFRNDSFDLRRASDNPLVESQIGKKDWAISNKVVGFNVDIGTQNQSIFHGFQVDQRGSTATAESLELLNQMANSSGNRKSSTQSVSLFNLYKNRSYNCTVNMMGNAMIQPTMYFNLRYVPMFSGPYMITSVNHVISPGSFETILEGVRQPMASLPKVTAYIQSLKTTLLATIVDKTKEDKVPKKSDTKVNKGDIINQRNDALNKGLDNDATIVSEQQSCSASTEYNTYKAGTPNKTLISYKNIIQIINDITSDPKLRYIVFATMYLQSDNSQGLESYEHNYAGVDISKYWGEGNSGFFSSKKFYYCSPKQIPYVYFDNATNHVKMLVDRFKNKFSVFGNSTPEDIAKFYILYFNANSNAQNVYDSIKKTDSVGLKNIESEIGKSISLYNAITNKR